MQSWFLWHPKAIVDAVTVGLPASPFNWNSVTIGSVKHFLRCWPPARHIIRSIRLACCVRLRWPWYLYSTSAAVVRNWRYSDSMDPVISLWPHPAGFFRWWSVSHHTTCFSCATPWRVTIFDIIAQARLTGYCYADDRQAYISALATSVSTTVQVTYGLSMLSSSVLTV